MGIIELMDGFFVEIDPLNYTLKRKYVGKTRDGSEKEAVKIYGHYPNLKAALKRFVELIRLSEIINIHVSLDEYLKALEKADKRVMEFLSNLKLSY